MEVIKMKKMTSWLKNTGVSIFAVLLTGYIALYPAKFTTLGSTLEGLMLTYFTWKYIYPIIIIALLVINLIVLIKKQSTPR